MAQQYRPQAGTPLAELETPCLILDMDALDHNMDLMADYYRHRPSKLRGHSKNHKTPALAWRQIRRGGTIGGVCAAKVSEAEVMVHSGIPSVLVTSEIVAPLKIERLCSLAEQAEMLVACENPENARALSGAASAHGVDLGVLIEQETGLRRCGVQDVEQGVALARVIANLPGLRFRGIMSHQMMAQPSSNREDRVTEGRQLVQPVIDLKNAIEASGIAVDIVSTGETWSYDVAGEIPGVTEIQGGTYLLMETAYSYMTDFLFAGQVLTTIISTPRPGVAVGDAGIRAVGSMKGLPAVANRPGLVVERIDTDHVIFSGGEIDRLTIGDQVALIPGQQDAMVSRWDRFIGVRDGRVEAVWDIQARGCHS